MMAEKKINYAAIFGSYVMRTQYEIMKAAEAEKEKSEKKTILQETVEDYIEQA